MKHCPKLLLSLCILLPGYAAAAPDIQLILQQLKLPVGFKISLFADNLPNARSLALGDDGVVYVGTRNEGNVYAVQDSNQNGISEKKYLLAKGLYMPNGLAYKNNTLYVAETNRIIRYDNISKQLNNPPEPKIVYDQFPQDKQHGWKYLAFGLDNKLYTSVGSPCNVCEPNKAIYGSLVRLNPDGSDFEIIAHGIRNSVGFDWQPTSGALFFTDNGRDNLGDDIPPDELNQWSAKDQHFGFPYCHGGEVLDPELGSNKNCKQYVAPVWNFKAHRVALGIKFYTGKQFPASYKNQLFVAQHGSWNRSTPAGYQVVTVEFKNGKAVAEKVFIEGWLTSKGEVLGRPTDILQLPDGSLLISDDTLGVIYRVTYQG